ncbi:hypothetical protein PCASD_26247 [Puccinia coronata f. sp. avenae]|uniref:Secreted protein n=1 Tax=Puccinia coronata f. sp. avenae TaxID=200324 RepID=A0A2N5S397_9BASI|nr:hypothetical protein PCASD_26247 [Puccinia coronata f. sp. avenae]
MLRLFLAALTTPPMLVSASTLLLALHFVTLCYSAFSGKKAIFDAKSAGAQRSGRTFAPCALSPTLCYATATDSVAEPLLPTLRYATATDSVAEPPLEDHLCVWF